MTVDRRWILSAASSSIVAALTHGMNAQTALKEAPLDGAQRVKTIDSRWKELVSWFKDGLKQGAGTIGYPDTVDIIDDDYRKRKKRGNIAYARKVSTPVADLIWKDVTPGGLKEQLMGQTILMGRLTGKFWRLDNPEGVNGGVWEEHFDDARDSFAREQCKKGDKSCVLCNDGPRPDEREEKKG